MRRRIALLAMILLTVVGCRQDMHDQPKVEPFESSPLFDHGQSARLPVEGTVARGREILDDVLNTGLESDGKFTRELPVTLDRSLLDRGHERYDIFCSPCHGRLGDGPRGARERCLRAADVLRGAGPAPLSRRR